MWVQTTWEQSDLVIILILFAEEVSKTFQQTTFVVIGTFSGLV